MKTKNETIPSADQKRVSSGKAGWVLLLGTVVITWLCLPERAIGEAALDAAVASESMLVSDEQAQSVQDLISSLRKDNPYDRQRAAIALGNAKDVRAVEPLLQSLQDDDDFVRNFAARALGNIGDPRALDPLIKALGDKHVLVRCSAARALGNLKDARVVDPLIKTLENEDFLVQRSAAEALGEVGDPRGVDPLMKALGSEDSYIQTGASSALVRIGEAAIPKLVAELSDVKIGPRAAEILKELRWQPSSEQDRERFEVALKKK
jgi:HEAT repeat protein